MLDLDCCNLISLGNNLINYTHSSWSNEQFTVLAIVNGDGVHVVKQVNIAVVRTAAPSVRVRLPRSQRRTALSRLILIVLILTDNG